MISVNSSQIVLALLLFITSVFHKIDAKPIIVIQNESVGGGYAFLRLAQGVKVTFLNEIYLPDQDGYIALGFDRDLSGTQQIISLDSSGNEEVYKFFITPGKYKEDYITGIDPNKVDPPDALLNRIIKEAQMVTEARGKKIDSNAWRTERFGWPVHGRVSGVYGSQRFYNGTPKSPHWGIDIAVPRGTPVSAPASGVVVLAAQDLYFSGSTIIINHGGGLTSSFLHLSSIDVSVGDEIKQGQVIGRVGTTGRSTGPHLDWRMNLHSTRIDASLWVKPERFSLGR